MKMLVNTPALTERRFGTALAIQQVPLPVCEDSRISQIVDKGV
jgi:hypothetical protein